MAGTVASPVSLRSRSSTRTLAVVFAGFCAFLTLYAPQPLLPMLSDAFQVSAKSVTRVMGISTFAVVLAAPLVGILADRLGRKQVIVRSALLLALPSLLAATSTGLNQLLFWRFWMGVFTPGIFAVTIAYINEEWTEGAGSAMSAYVGGTVLGGFSGRMVSGFVASASSWRWSFVALGVLTLAGGIAMWSWLPGDHRAARKQNDGAAPAGEGNVARAMLRHLRDPRLAATYIVGFGLLFTLVAAFTYVNFHLAAPPFKLTTRGLSLVFTVYLVGAAVTPMSGRVIDRMGHRFALTMATLSGAAGMALTLIPNLWAVVAGLAMCCTGVWISQSAATSYIGTVAREARAAAVGLYVMFYYLGGSCGSEVPGHFWARGGWPVCVALIVAVQILSIVVGLIFWRPTRAAVEA
ncbi:MAG TPA: MFS transporter [Verrucomicrobiae bacterium]|nr:MFS transporter [Verrucomicrobiae bacterium]